MRPLLVLCAPAFAGKSTLASRLEAAGFAVVSFDAINGERALPDGGQGLPGEEWGRTFEIAVERVTNLLRDGRDVVLDDTSCFRFLRDRFREVARAAGREALIVHLPVPEATLRTRIDAARATGSRPVPIEAVLVEHLRTFEPPQPDEAAVTLASPGEIDSWFAGLERPPLDASGC